VPHGDSAPTFPWCPVPMALRKASTQLSPLRGGDGSSRPQTLGAKDTVTALAGLNVNLVSQTLAPLPG
jgi:hypothetical protein